MVFGRKQEASDDGTGPLKEVQPPLSPEDGLFRQVMDVAWDSAGNTYISDGYINSPGMIPEAKDPGGWNGLVYFRLHGSPRKYYSAYDSDFLRSLATRMAHLSRVSRSLLWWL
jgi:hypothetical protein